MSGLMDLFVRFRMIIHASHLVHYLQDVQQQ